MEPVPDDTIVTYYGSLTRYHDKEFRIEGSFESAAFTPETGSKFRYILRPVVPGTVSALHTQDVLYAVHRGSFTIVVPPACPEPVPGVPGLPGDFADWAPSTQMAWYTFLYGEAFLKMTCGEDGSWEFEVLDPSTVTLTVNTEE